MMPTRTLAGLRNLVLPAAVGLVAACLAATTWAAAPPAPQLMPFTGCPSHGLAGPVDAPDGPPVSWPMSRAAARALGVYRGRSLAALAPRGWQCKVVYGDSGTTLLITPQPLPWEALQTAGPAVQAVFIVGDAAGRIETASLSARFFPTLMHDYIRRIIAEALVPAARVLDTPPYPGDVTRRLSPTMVEFSTPGNQDGFGTDSLLTRSSLPVRGLIAVNPRSGDIYELFVRLPRAQQALERALLGTEALRLPDQTALGTPR